MVGYDTSDDACVFQVNPDTAIIQTVDFFTPIVDDPYLFGQIAAANALSDVYAMGGQPVLAMNLLCVPNCLTPDVLRKILTGGHEKAMEAGCTIAGGHTIEDQEPKYGLCVTGFVHPAQILRNIGAKAGDVLLLTKPLGSGIIATGAKADLVEKADYDAACAHMATLNAKAVQAAQEVGEIHACTDVTGFGLLGHALEMARGSHVTICLDSAAIPLMDGVSELAESGIIPGGAYRNQEYVQPELFTAETADPVALDIMCDPQTSGGLLLALPEAEAHALLEKMQIFAPWVRIIGHVKEWQGKALWVV